MFTSIRRPTLTRTSRTVCYSVQSCCQVHPKPKTAIVMLDMGGAKGDQKKLTGVSPILKRTNCQGQMLVEMLNRCHPATAPHKHYVCFKYVSPFTSDAFSELEEDGVERAVIFAQNAQYSCTTTGSSISAIFDYYKRRVVPRHVKFSLVERWATHPSLIRVYVEKIQRKLALFDPNVRDNVLILFSAHSLPLSAVTRGDTYPLEVASTVTSIVLQLNVVNPYRLVWQSKLGVSDLLEPYTDDAIKAYAKKGNAHLLVVPLGFVNEHIEKLCDVANEAGIKQMEMTDTPCMHPTFIEALTDIVMKNLDCGPRVSKQVLSRCPHCDNPKCFKSKEFFKKICGG